MENNGRKIIKHWIPSPQTHVFDRCKLLYLVGCDVSCFGLQMVSCLCFKPRVLKRMQIKEHAKSNICGVFFGARLQVVRNAVCYHKQCSLRVPTRPGKPGKMRVHLENLEISWNFEKFNKYHGKMT